MDGVSGNGLWRAVNVGGVGNGHQLVIANQLVGCNIRNGGPLWFCEFGGGFRVAARRFPPERPSRGGLTASYRNHLGWRGQSGGRPRPPPV